MLSLIHIYAFEAGELESYRASLAANVECRSAIEAAISSNYGDNRLDVDAAVKSVLEQFSSERVRYVLANTIQQKDFDGRIPKPLKEWAKSVEVCPENASRFLVDKANPGLTALFVDAFRQQTEPEKEVTSEKTVERDPEVVAWENDEITSVEVKTVEVKSPVAPMPEEAAKAPKAHRLTAEEKEIKAAVMDTLKGQIAYNLSLIHISPAPKPEKKSNIGMILVIFVLAGAAGAAYYYIKFVKGRKPKDEDMDFFDDEGYEEEPYINEDDEPQIAEDAETDGDED